MNYAERLLNILSYIEHVEQTREETFFSVTQHKQLTLFQHDLEPLPGVSVCPGGEDSEWLRVERLRVKEHPSIPQELLECISGYEDPRKEVVWQEQGDPCPLFHEYRERWKAWASEEAKRRKTIEVYTKLFELQRALQSEGGESQSELVWGLGMALHRTPSGKIEYPLVTRAVEVEIEEQEGHAIVVRPRETPWRLELGAFHVANNSGASVLEDRFAQELFEKSSSFTPFHQDHFQELFHAAVSHLDPTGRLVSRREESTLATALPQATSSLAITDTWVIFSRKRSTSFFKRDLVKLKDFLLGGKAEGAVLEFVKEPADEPREKPKKQYRGLLGGADVQEPSEDLFFPRPYNEEQLSIIRELDREQGVVVQGPPGTGKTHTIANIICHYLANGKRVLVTSKGEAALSVLRDKIPLSIRSLVISILTNERQGLKQLEAAVRKIAGEVTALDVERLREEIAECQRSIDTLHRELSLCDNELKRSASRHLTPILIGEEEILPEKLSRSISPYLPLPDWLSSATPREGDLSEELLVLCREARERLKEDLKYLPHLQRLSSFTQIPEREEIEEVLQAWQEAEILAARGVVAGKDIVGLKGQLDKVSRVVNTLEATADHWLLTLLEGDKGDYRIVQATTLASDIAALVEVRKVSGSVAVEGHMAAMELPYVVEAIVRGAQGGKPVSLFTRHKSVIREHLAKIKVDGVCPSTAEEWQKVRLTIELNQQALKLWSRLKVLVRELGQELDEPPSHLRFLEVVGGRIEAAFSVWDEVKVLQQGAPGSDPLPKLVRTLGDQLRLIELNAKVQRFLTEVTPLTTLPGSIGEGWMRLMSALVGRGDGEAAMGDIEKLKERLFAIRPDLEIVSSVAAIIEREGAPAWAQRIREIPPLGSDEVIPPDAFLYWRSSIGMAKLRALPGRSDVKRLQEIRERCEAKLAREYERLVELSTLVSLKEKLSPRLKSALQSYMSALKDIGSGKGVRAERYRADARAAMEVANRAVPCWIMPHWRVSETLPPECGLFDLVIIDEASQSDLWALPALLRGKKILVVGDDEQISPTTFEEEREIVKLKNLYLSDQPFGSLMLPGKSIYDLSKAAFPSLIMLREHFRCTEPIIEFSNRLCYGGEVKCVRIPRQSERIDPPLVDVFVSDGYRKGDTNPAEAYSVVTEILRLVNNPNLQGRTIGVISLLGRAQAKLISDLLMSHVGEERLMQHDIVCGDAMTFQGQERDIIFLSMVVTADEVVAQTRRDIRQRYNVACSRARDRMYLFRSVQREDLKHGDLRASLLDHFASPLRIDRAKLAHKRELCDSDFEREVFDELVQRGYRVFTQVKVGSYSIDLVVEGEEDRRLAIECDGDRYHTPDRWHADFIRQRTMERIGWRFWRCWGSTFALDRQGCINDLIAALESMGIAPVGDEDSIPSSYVEYREVHSQQVPSRTRVLPQDNIEAELLINF